MTSLSSSFYLKHDFNAREDEKTKTLVMKMGARGYGIYWMVIEDLYRNKGRLTRDYNALAWSIREEAKDIKTVVEDFDLFYSAHGKIASRRVDRAFREREEAIEQARTAGRASAAKRSVNGRSTTVQPGEESRGEERKGEEITTAPSAVGLAKEASKAVEARRLQALLSDARLPFDFGQPPDYFRKGILIQNLPVETCWAILAQMPRLGKETRDLIRARIDQKAEEMTPGQRKATRA